MDWTREGQEAERPVRILVRGGAGLSRGRDCECGEEQGHDDQKGAVVSAILRTKVAQMPVSI